MDPETVRFISAPNRRDILLNAAALSRESLISVGGGVFLLVLGGVAFLLGDLLSLPVAIVGFGLLTGLVVAPFVWWAIRQRTDLFLAPIDVEVDNAGVSFKSPIAESRHEWAVFRRVRETGRAFAFDTGAGTSIVLAKRGADPEPLEALRRLLAGRGLLRPRSIRHTALRRGAAAALGAGLAGLVVFGPQVAGSLDRTATIDLAATITGRTVSIAGSTDLPDGTIVGIQVFQRDEWERELADGAQPSMDEWPWQSYDEILVRDGRFETTASVAGWPTGRGLAVAYFWVDGRQPAAVIGRFGRDGAGLRGRDVVEDPRNGRTLEITAPFEIGP